MAQEIYHRSEWGNPTETWGNTYLNADLTNELYKRASEYENSWVTDQLLNGVGTKPSIILTPTAYEDGFLHSVKPKGGENLLVQSNKFDTTWATNCNLTSGQLGYDGTNDAWLLEKDATGFRNLYQNVSTLIGVGTLSIYAKANSNSNIIIRCIGGTDAQGFFDLSNGTLAATPVNCIDAQINAVGNGWYRCSIVFNTSSSTSVNLYPDYPFGGTSAGSIYIQDAQLERGAEANSYIETTTTAKANGDFNFTRGSSATRVNELGLVSDVQILSGELVQNGDFEQIGSELVTNGGFDTDSDWSKGSGCTIENGKAKYTNASSGQGFTQSNFLTIGKFYKITFTVSDYSQGSVKIRYPFNMSNTITANGTYTEYGEAVTDDLFLQNVGTTTLSIDNVSVKEVGQNWTLTSGAFFTENGIKLTHTPTAGVLSTTYAPLTTGRKYRMTYEITENNDGGIKLNSATVNTLVSTVGVHTKEFISNQGTLSIARTDPSGNDVTIDNISVVEVTDDTDLPRINYTNFDYEDVLGDELVTNGDFSDGLTNWTDASNWWSVVNGKAYHPASTSMKQLYQDVTTEVNKKYKITVDVDIISGTPQVFWDKVSGQEGQNLTQGLNEIVVTTFKTNSRIYFGRVSPTNAEFYIDNVSVKELTEDVVVPYSGEGSLKLEPQSTNKVTYSEDFSQYSTVSVTLESGYLAPDGSNTAYKVSGTVGTSNIYLSSVASGTDTRTIWARTVSGTGTANLCSYGQNTNNNFTITPQWQRFEVNGTTTSAGAGNFYAVDFRFQEANALSELIIWGAQAEALSYATSYIPTNGSTVTRLADVCNNSGNSDLINSTEGVLYAEISALANDGTYRLMSISDGTAINRIVLGYSNGSNLLLVQVRSSGNNEVNFTYSISDITLYNKIALLYKSNEVTIWVNGVKGTSDTSASMPTGLSEFNFNYTNSLPLYGNVKCVAVFKEALSNTELQKLTTI